MKKGFIGFVAMLVCCLFVGATTARAKTPEEKCQFKRAKEKGKYEMCVQNWLGKCYGNTGSSACNGVKLAKCRVKYHNKWTRMQKLTGTTCDAPRYMDSGRGIIDNLTGLIWEKKTTAVGSGSNFADPSDVDNVYDWTALDGDDTDEDGTVFTDFLPTLSLGVGLDPEFFGWRIPTFAELQTILLPELYPCTTSPCIDPIFGSTRSFYWSATTLGNFPDQTWLVVFNDGFVVGASKASTSYVRAVRGGL